MKRKMWNKWKCSCDALHSNLLLLHQLLHLLILVVVLPFLLLLFFHWHSFFYYCESCCAFRSIRYFLIIVNWCDYCDFRSVESLTMKLHWKCLPWKYYYSCLSSLKSLNILWITLWRTLWRNYNFFNLK